MARKVADMDNGQLLEMLGHVLAPRKDCTCGMDTTLWAHLPIRSRPGWFRTQCKVCGRILGSREVTTSGKEKTTGGATVGVKGETGTDEKGGTLPTGFD